MCGRSEARKWVRRLAALLIGGVLMGCGDVMVDAAEFQLRGEIRTLDTLWCQMAR
jgi:hypothetical protein